MSDFWTGYANVNDDVRHTYERVFYGRELTDDITPQDMPGIAPEAPSDITPGPSPSEPAPDAFAPEPVPAAPPPDAFTPEDRDFYHSPYPWTEAAAPVEAPTIDATPIEAPKIEAPGNSGPSSEHDEVYNSIWGKAAEQGAENPAPAIEAPAIEPPQQEPHLGY